jgi:hypothetical protein
MIWFILGIIIGIWFEWRYQNANHIIESIKEHLNIK